MQSRLLSLTSAAGVFALALLLSRASTSVTASAAEPFVKSGPLADEKFFPLAVWLQNPANASKYAAAGINVYVALSRRAGDEQFAELKRSGIYVVCGQNERTLARKDDPTIIAWMHGDEPDNAQRIPGEKGYGPPILPEKIVENYKRIKAADPSRPVLLNLGQGVAWDQWVGRGVRRNHPEDYPEYVKGSDITSFDIYPACHEHPDVAGKLWIVADGVSRLRKWAGDDRLVWNCIECTHINNPEAKATPQQVKAEVWMSLVRGSRGIIYFVHEFKPQFVEAGLLADAEMLSAVTDMNKQIHELAPVLNCPTVAGGVAIDSPADAPVEAMVKRKDGATYVFAVAMRGAPAKAIFKIAGVAGAAKAEVLGEGRSLEVHEGAFRDEFRPWEVHLYRIRPQ
jgi:hypothetical protein